MLVRNLWSLRFLLFFCGYLGSEVRLGIVRLGFVIRVVILKHGATAADSLVLLSQLLRLGVVSVEIVS